MRVSNFKFQIGVLVFGLGVSPVVALAGTLTGVVRNGTTGRVVSGQDVVLIQLSAGMETAASTKTDAQGRYTLDHAAIGQGPVLVRVPYKGVNFHQNVPPGRAVADVDVFEPTTDPQAFQITSRAIIMQPNGPALIVGEEYSIENNSNPPAAYFKNDGTFEFEIPEGAQLGQVAAWGSSGMPVSQGTMEKGKNRYAIAYPFRPGASGIRLAYQVPYGSNEATLRAASPYAARRVSLIAPPTMQIQSAGFTAAGTEQGWNVYARDGVAARAALDISVAGTAPPPDAAGAPEAAGQESTASGAALSQMPGRLDSLRFPLIAGFGALFVLGLLFLLRKPRMEAAVAPAGTAPAKSSKVAQAVADVHREVGHNLDEIKDTLFRLELRRQAGTITEEEYTRERARAEKILRDFLKG